MGREIVPFSHSLPFFFPHTFWAKLVSDLFYLQVDLWVPLCISRPKQVKDVAHQDEVVRVLINTLETGSVIPSSSSSSSSSYSCCSFYPNSLIQSIAASICALQCPHMLFYGPPGTGKTTTALAIAHQLFGYAFAPSNFNSFYREYCLYFIFLLRAF